jgi:hypothetical protein
LFVDTQFTPTHPPVVVSVNKKRCAPHEQIETCRVYKTSIFKRCVRLGLI